MEMNQRAITWTGLLAQWTQAAQASLAIPEEHDGPAWRRSIAPLITLQAVTFALNELGDLPVEERPVARDRAALLIDESLDLVEAVWGAIDQSAPDSVGSIVVAAETALVDSQYAGLIELWWPGPDRYTIPAIDLSFIAAPCNVGCVAVMAPGTIVLPGEPVAWWIDREESYLRDLLKGCRVVAGRRPHQVYRSFDADGVVLSDQVIDLESPSPSAFPLIVPLLGWGEPIGHFPLDAEQWNAQQAQGMGGDIPVQCPEDVGPASANEV
jgi:hypothetical protein